MKILSFDLDGTFFNDQKEYIQENIDIIKKYRDNGYGIVLCTGRMLPSAFEVYKNIGVDAHIIACNGAVVFENRDGELIKIKENVFELEKIREITKIIDATGIYYHFYDEKKIYTNRPYDVAKEFYSKYLDDFENDVVISEKLEPMLNEKLKVHKVGVRNDGRYDFKEFRKQIESYKIADVRMSQNDFLDIGIVGVNKWNALEHLIKNISSDIEKLIYIGDQENDLECILNADIGVAMKNSPIHVRSEAKFVTEFDNNNLGFYKFLKDNENMIENWRKL